MRETNRTYHTGNRYSKATKKHVRRLGFVGKSFGEIAHDGHVCDSFAEKIIDDWLADHKIPHTRNVPYPGSKMTADFFIAKKNLLIEFFGLKGVNRKYDGNLRRKFKIIRRQKLKVISLFSEDLLKATFSRKLGKILTAPT